MTFVYQQYGWTLQFYNQSGKTRRAERFIGSYAELHDYVASNFSKSSIGDNFKAADMDNQTILFVRNGYHKTAHNTGRVLGGCYAKCDVPRNVAIISEPAIHNISAELKQLGGVLLAISSAAICYYSYVNFLGY